MKVLRKRELETNNIQVGDQIILSLEDLGDFTATAQKITDQGVLFLFDECITKRPMNKILTNEGGYEKSDLCKWISNVLFIAFPEELRIRISNLTIPTYGQTFSHDNWYGYLMKLDDDEQLPLMKNRKNRIADFNNEDEWYWLQNATKKEVSSALFAYVSSNGYMGYGNASRSSGVRPVFWLGN